MFVAYIDFILPVYNKRNINFYGSD